MQILIGYINARHPVTVNLTRHCITVGDLHIVLGRIKSVYAAKKFCVQNFKSFEPV